MPNPRERSKCAIIASTLGAKTEIYFLIVQKELFFKKADVPLEEKCPQCDSNLVLKSGRFGEFTACSNYPKCKYVKQQTIGVPCPQCSEGEISQRRSKTGKTFYGCTRYPDCDFVAWAKPLAEKCPDCGSPYLVEKNLKSGHFAQCPNKECKYKRELEPVPASA